MDNSNIFIDYEKILSFNRLFYLIMTIRGTGKTFGAKKLAISRFLKKHMEFIYLRRYKEELKKLTKNDGFKFFEDLVNNNVFPDHTFKIREGLISVDDKVAGYITSLSTATIEKSISYAKVTLIIFDEFIIAKSNYHYLPDEVQAFLEFYETVARLRDNVIVLFLANKISVSNPYFIYFKVPFSTADIIKVGNEILVYKVTKDKFIETKKKTRFAQLVKNTNYGAYLTDNEFLKDNDSFLGNKSGKSRCIFIMIYKNYELGVWFDNKDRTLYLSSDTDPKCQIKYSLRIDDHTSNYQYLSGIAAEPLFKFFIESYKKVFYTLKTWV